MSETVSTKRNRVYPHAFDHDLARAMRKKGMTYRAIADALGVSESAIGFTLNPSTNAKMRAYVREYQRRGTCIDCGGQASRNSTRPVDRCRSCFDIWCGITLGTSARDGELHCARCDRWMDDDRFPRSASANKVRRGRHKWCRDCNVAQRREYRSKLSPEKRAEQLERNRARKRLGSDPT